VIAAAYARIEFTNAHTTPREVATMMSQYSMFFFACPAMIALVACGGSKAPEAASPVGSTQGGSSAASTKETPAQAATSGNVQIAQEILSACGISASDAFFPFDSSRLDKKDIKPLNDVVTCFTTGPMKGRSLKLVGRADPRGTSGYNLTLGQARADSVQKYVTDRGVAAGNAQSTSRGAMDATGTDETGWARDRRVDIMLGS
jgi:peptidoglycan-associated lipoprotein